MQALMLRKIYGMSRLIDPSKKFNTYHVLACIYLMHFNIGGLLRRCFVRLSPLLLYCELLNVYIRSRNVPIETSGALKASGHFVVI